MLVQIFASLLNVSEFFILTSVPLLMCCWSLSAGSQARREGGQKGSSPGGPETQRGPGFRIVKIECKTTAYGRH